MDDSTLCAREANCFDEVSETYFDEEYKELSGQLIGHIKDWKDKNICPTCALTLATLAMADQFKNNTSLDGDKMIKAIVNAVAFAVGMDIDHCEIVHVSMQSTKTEQ